MLRAIISKENTQRSCTNKLQSAHLINKVTVPCRIIIIRYEPFKQFILKELQVELNSVSAIGRHSSGLKAGVRRSDRGDGVHVLMFPAVSWESMTQTFKGPQRFGRSQANRLGMLSQKDSILPFLK